jgi:hypothetical protein
MASQVRLFVALVALVGLTVTIGAHAAPATQAAIDNFKNYALSTCLADGYKSDEVVKDAAASARGYLELGSLPLEAHTEATKLGREFLKKNYESASGQSLVLMKCLDFYHSKELANLVSKYRGKTKK